MVLFRPEVDESDGERKEKDHFSLDGFVPILSRVTVRGQDI